MSDCTQAGGQRRFACDTSSSKPAPLSAQRELPGQTELPSPGKGESGKHCWGTEGRSSFVPSPTPDRQSSVQRRRGVRRQQRPPQQWGPSRLTLICPADKPSTAHHRDTQRNSCHRPPADVTSFGPTDAHVPGCRPPECLLTCCPGASPGLCVNARCRAPNAHTPM